MQANQQPAYVVSSAVVVRSSKPQISLAVRSVYNGNLMSYYSYYISS